MCPNLEDTSLWSSLNLVPVLEKEYFDPNLVVDIFLKRTHQSKRFPGKLVGRVVWDTLYTYECCK